MDLHVDATARISVIDQYDVTISVISFSSKKVCRVSWGIVLDPVYRCARVYITHVCLAVFLWS